MYNIYLFEYTLLLLLYIVLNNPNIFALRKLKLKIFRMLHIFDTGEVSGWPIERHEKIIGGQIFMTSTLYYYNDRT